MHDEDLEPATSIEDEAPSAASKSAAADEAVTQEAADEVGSSASTADEASGDDEVDEVIITLGDAKPPAPEEPEAAPAWVKELRKNYRELQKRNRELEARLATPVAQPVTPTLGKKPELADYEYDTDRYEAELLKWADQKKQIELANQEADARAKKQQEAWSARLQAYESAKAKIKVADFDAAEAAVQSTFDITQQGLIIKSADNPAALVHALGTHEKAAKELAAIKDMVEFVKAVTKLELTMKVHKRNKPPAPESPPIRGNGRVSGAVDPTLERLRNEAARTGDTSKVVAYKRQLKQKSR